MDPNKLSMLMMLLMINVESGLVSFKLSFEIGELVDELFSGDGSVCDSIRL